MSGKLLYFTGSSAPCSVMTMGGMLENGRKSEERGYMHTYSLFTEFLGQKLTQHCKASILQLKRKEESQVECSLASMFLWVSGDVSSFPRQSISPRSFLCSYPVRYLSPSFPNSRWFLSCPGEDQSQPWRWLYSSLAFFFILQSLHNYILLSFQRLWF